MSNRRWFDFLRRGMLACLVVSTVASAAQDAVSRPEPGAADSLAQAVHTLSEQVLALDASVAELRSDAERARAENRELRREIEELRGGNSKQRAGMIEPVSRADDTITMAAIAKAKDFVTRSQSEGSAEDSTGPQTHDQQEQKATAHAATIEEEYELLSGKVDDQYQTKVESASKYRMRISGIVLMNLFSNQGTVDNIDLPTRAYPRQPGDTGGSFGATLRQSEIGFEVFGPRVAGARTKADLQLDLAGGFPSVQNGVNSGSMRLRTATMRMDWKNTSLVVGQDGLFISPNSPTSFATLAVPALSYAGNLWSWVPQLRVEHRIALGDASSLLFQGGILDPLTGETPGTNPYRAAGPGESSRQPAYGTRVAWTRDFFGQPLRIGLGGFYGRQDYGYARTVDAWAAMTDLEVPLGSRFSISGKLYRGRGLGGLYGGLGQSVLFSNNDPANPYTQLIGLNSVGGWAQLKYRPARKIEINTAFGMDNPYAKDLNYFQYPQSYYGAPWSRNRAGFANFIYRPRSDLLFSAEYRQMETNSISTGESGAGHLNLMMGVLF
jgi:regulator of replication initiation timing